MPDQLCVSNNTYLLTRQGTVYLNLLTDAYSHRIIGAYAHASMHTDGCRAALPASATFGLVYHSDWGTQYYSDAYQSQLSPAGLVCSMTEGPGDCSQNALAERVNGILKEEFLFLLPTDVAEARLLVAQAVQRYNHERPYLSLNYLTSQQAKSPAGKSERGPCLFPVSM